MATGPAAPAQAETVIVTGADGADGMNRDDDAESGEAASAVADASGDSHNVAIATGGQGGDANRGEGGSGGASDATAITQPAAGDATAEANAIGGTGGEGDPPGSGGPADALASAQAEPGGTATATAEAVGGAGADYFSPGSTGGTATAHATGIAAGEGAVVASATATGGTGGWDDGKAGTGLASASGVSESGRVSATARGFGGAGAEDNGGDGADAVLIDAVSAETSGSVVLRQRATGGAGGNEGYFTKGGDAFSSLRFEHAGTGNLDARSEALGGDAEYGYAGAAEASIDVTSEHSSFSAVAAAWGGDAVAGGGDAVAHSVGTGAGASLVEAVAIGGRADERGAPRGSAQARAVSNVESGWVSANSSSGSPGGWVDRVYAEAITLVRNPSTAVSDSFAGVGTPLPAERPAAQGLAIAVSEPDAAEVLDLLGTNSRVRRDFSLGQADARGAPSQLVAYGVFGGSTHEGEGISREELTIQLHLDPEELGAPEQRALLGFLDPVATGGGFDLLDLLLRVQGTALLDENFTDPDAAAAFLDDRVVDLGVLSEYYYSDWINLSFDVAYVSTTPGDAFSFDFILGNATPGAGSPIPEPMSAPLVLMGLVMLARRRRASRAGASLPQRGLPSPRA